jgi:hypothetical protein
MNRQYDDTETGTQDCFASIRSRTMSASAREWSKLSTIFSARADAERGLFGVTLWMFCETSAGIVRENTRLVIMKHKNIIRIALATAFILLLPLLAMQITDEVVWDLADFAVAGALFFGTALTYELVARKMGSIAYRVAVGIALGAAFLLVWVNLAVGLIGSEEELANLMFVGVLAVGVIGAFIARFRPHGMARALFATALAQALVAVIALGAGLHQSPGSSVSEIVTVSGFFVALFLGSAGLFRKAAREQTPAGAGPEG